MKYQHDIIRMGDADSPGVHEVFVSEPVDALTVKGGYTNYLYKE